MNLATQLFLLAGVLLGTVAALAAAMAFDGPMWAELAGLAAGLLAAAMFSALGLRRPAPPPPTPTAPRAIERMSEAAAGDPLARQAVLEELDRLSLGRRASGEVRRLSRDPALYTLPPREFLGAVEAILTEQERHP